MRTITLLFQKDKNLKQPLYMQLYTYIKNEITSGHILAGEKLPAIRKAAKELEISLTTVEMAYSQLLVEGYVISKPQSGYYVTEVFGETNSQSSLSKEIFRPGLANNDTSDYIYDPSSFDFVKWKKAASKVFLEYGNMLYFESDPQGEAFLRHEISKYAYSSRGVVCRPDQIVIGAGTQQLTAHLARIMKKMSINNICTETPGYLPMQKILSDNGFIISKIPVDDDGIEIEKLPTNIPSAVYVSPNNQFPTGSVMPIGRRYKLLSWASENNSYILEDDYDSELRYFGKPIPALQGLKADSKVVYLGSFSSTLFPAIRISYMVLPDEMATIFHTIKEDYTQTCSKAEQLTLAIFMEEGNYIRGIKKLRTSYGQKLSICINALEKYGKNNIEVINNSSGLNIILKVKSDFSPAELCLRARELGAYVVPMGEYLDENSSKSTAMYTATLIFYYSKIPLEQLDGILEKMVKSWKLN